MHKKLILDAFQRAKKERNIKGDNKPSLVSMAEDISEFIHTAEGFYLGERSFRDYKKQAEALIDENKDININQLKVINGLCNYVGYENYIVFKSENTTNDNTIKNDKPIDNKELSTPRSTYHFFKKNKITIIIAILICLFFIYTSINQQRWMIWNGDSYEEVNFDTDKYNIGKLKLFKEERILYFKKVDPGCELEFFNDYGKVKIWYGKNLDGKLETFTSLGLHPETGKTLKPISKYMIRKYFCNKFK